MNDTRAVRYAPPWLTMFARLTAALILLATLGSSIEAARADAPATLLFMLPVPLAWSVALCMARRTAIVLPLAFAPWVLVLATLPLMRHWPRC